MVRRVAGVLISDYVAPPTCQCAQWRGLCTAIRETEAKLRRSFSGTLAANPSAPICVPDRAVGRRHLATF